jgi:phage gp36-like protein
MAYCTIDDVKKMIDEVKLIRLTDDENTSSINSDRLQEAINSAAEEIDTYIGGRIALPISGDTPPILGKLNVDIAIYNVYSRVKEAIPEVRAERYKAAIRFLEKLSEGKISIGCQPPPDPPNEGDYAGGSRVSVRDKIFDETTMGKY